MQGLAASGAEDTEAAARKLKLRLLGNIRLISELFKQKALGEKIVHACLASLIGDPKGHPSEDNVEVCRACCACWVTRRQLCGQHSRRPQRPPQRGHCQDAHVLHDFSGRLCTPVCAMWRLVEGPKGLSKGMPHACSGSVLVSQAVCEMVTIAGKALDETTREKRKTDSYFATLDRCALGRVEGAGFHLQGSPQRLCRLGQAGAAGALSGQGS